MKKANFLFVIVVIFLLATSQLHAEEKKRRIGFGVSWGKQFFVSGEGLVTYFDFPSFYVPIIISSHFRFEPEIGYYRYRRSDEDWKYSYTVLFTGCGIFYMMGKEKVDIYYGARLGLIHTSYLSEYSWNGQDKDEATKTDFYVGPAIGGEYFFTKHLSLGGEIQVNYIFIGKWSDIVGKRSESTIRTKTLFFLRWYL